MNADRCDTPGRPYLVGKSKEKMEAFVFQPDCKLWACPYCAEQNKRLWAVIALNGTNKLLDAGKRMSFITLTTRGGKGRTRESSLEAIAKGFPIVRRKAKYHMGEFEYFMIPEQHKNGIVHAHLIATNTLKKRFWKDASYHAGLGYIADVQDMDNAGMVPWYVSKYMGKEVHKLVWPKGFRRVRVSRGWPKLPEREQDESMEYSVFQNWLAAEWELMMLEDYGYTIDIKCDVGT